MKRISIIIFLLFATKGYCGVSLNFNDNAMISMRERVENEIKLTEQELILRTYSKKGEFMKALKAFLYEEGCPFCHELDVKDTQFHHVGEKHADISSLNPFVAWRRMRREIEASLLMCSSHHFLLHRTPHLKEHAAFHYKKHHFDIIEAIDEFIFDMRRKVFVATRTPRKDRAMLGEPFITHVQALKYGANNKGNFELAKTLWLRQMDYFKEASQTKDEKMKTYLYEKGNLCRVAWMQMGYSDYREFDTKGAVQYGHSRRLTYIEKEEYYQMCFDEGECR